MAEGPGGAQSKLDLPPSKTYRGTVEGDARGAAAASIEGTSVRARILLDDGSDWYVEPVSDAAGSHVVYRGSDVTESPGLCGVDGDAAGALPPESGSLDSFQEPGAIQPQLSSNQLALPPSLAGQVQQSGCVEAEIAFEADYQFYVANGSSTSATIADIDAVMNSVELIYARDAKISYTITKYLIQTSDTGKYPSTDAATRLSQFQTWWNANQTSVTRDAAHLMSNSPLNGLIGVSKIAVMCNRSEAYGISVSPNPVFANRVALTSHELGHNWAALHCDGRPDCAIMCSYVNGCAHDPTAFSMSSIREIETYRNLSGSCLAAGSGTPTPLSPTARSDISTTVRGTSTTISVLANDFDPNCSTLSLGTFSSTAISGGTVTSSGDNLVYTPAAGFIGKDNFTYTVRDAGGAQSSAGVTVDVQDYQPAESVTGATSGLEVRYYYVPPLDGSLGSMPTLNNPFLIETVPTLSFPSTDGTVGESGLTDKVAMQCTGTITLPLADTYTFYLNSDDGAKLYIDGTLRVDNDGIHTIRERSGSVSLAAGEHAVRIDYYDATGPSCLRLEIQSATIPRKEIPAAMWVGGVQIAYYALNSTVLPPLKALKPEKVGVATTINYPFTWGAFAGSGRTLHVGAVFEGYITVPSDGVYFFELTSEDGSKLYIGDRLVVDNDGVHNRVALTGGVALRAGAHSFRTEYFLREGGDALSIQVWSSSVTKQILPASWLSHVPAVHVPLEYATIDAAISAAAANSMVWVAAGTYTGTANKNLDFRGKSITLRGGGGAALTIIDAQGSGRAFRFVNHSAQNAAIEGFTIRNAANTAGGAGGAMLFDNSTLHVRDCTITGNTNPGDGGALGFTGNSNPVFEDCVISGNHAGGAGGAIQAQSSARPQFLGCTITGNHAGTLGGGAYAINGGYVYLERSILWGNGALIDGSEAWTGDAQGTVEVACSDVLTTGVGGAGSELLGSNNITAMPGFCAPAPSVEAPTTAGGYRLASTSPALPGASPCGQLMGARGAGCASAVTAIESVSAPAVAALEQNVPNPFNPDTRISFTTTRDAQATLRVYDAGGRLVTTLLNRPIPAGRHTLTWQGTDSRNRPVASGVYYYQLRSGGQVRTRSMVVLK